VCDATWAAGKISIEEDEPKFVPEYFKDYFLAPPKLFVKNHFPLQSQWTLLDSPPSFEDFINGPVVYKEAFSFNVIPLQPHKMEVVIPKNNSVSFTLATPENYSPKEVTLVINRGSSSKNIVPNIHQEQNTLSIKYNFTKLGFHDVHIKIDDTIITTYVIIVRKNNF